LQGVMTTTMVKVLSIPHFRILKLGVSLLMHILIDFQFLILGYKVVGLKE